MVFYRTMAFFSALILLSVSIYFFIEDRDDDGKVFLFLAVFVYLNVFYIFKAMYYLRHRATFNELSFVFYLPIIPIILISIAEYAGVNDIFLDDFFVAVVTLNQETVQTYEITFAGLLSLPYFFFGIYILLRSRLRYQFIRWRGHSEGGPPATFVALILTIIIPIAYAILGYAFEELILIIFAFSYLLVGILSLVV